MTGTALTVGLRGGKGQILVNIVTNSILNRTYLFEIACLACHSVILGWAKTPTVCRLQSASLL